MKYFIFCLLLLLVNTAHAWQYRVEVIIYPTDKTTAGKAFDDLKSYTTIDTNVITLNDNRFTKTEDSQDEKITYEKIQQEYVFKIDSQAIEYYEAIRAQMKEIGNVKIHKCMHTEYGETKNSPCTIEEEIILIK